MIQTTLKRTEESVPMVSLLYNSKLFKFVPEYTVIAVGDTRGTWPARQVPTCQVPGRAPGNPLSQQASSPRAPKVVWILEISGGCVLSLQFLVTSIFTLTYLLSKLDI